MEKGGERESKLLRERREKEEMPKVKMMREEKEKKNLREREKDRM